MLQCSFCAIGRNVQTIPHSTNYCILLWLVSDSGWDNLELQFAVDSRRKFTFIFPTPIPCSPVHVPASVILNVDKPLSCQVHNTLYNASTLNKDVQFLVLFFLSGLGCSLQHNP